MINRAAAAGPSTVPWWMDWRGECAAIVAGGPSVKRADVEKLRDRIHVVAIKVAVDICPWADAVYGCDSAWWASRQALPKFRGLKLTYDGVGPGLNKIQIDRSSDAMLTETPGLVGSGGNSGYQALNLVTQFGATGILLIGYDMRSTGNSPHWYGRNDWPGANNPIDDNYRRWSRAFEGSAQTLRDLGVDVVNASSNTALTCFRRAGIEETLGKWGL